jgi:hypothetical protein
MSSRKSMIVWLIVGGVITVFEPALRSAPLVPEECLPSSNEEPADGHWTGHFKFVYESPFVSQAAGAAVIYTLEGDLSFDASLGEVEGTASGRVRFAGESAARQITGGVPRDLKLTVRGDRPLHTLFLNASDAPVVASVTDTDKRIQVQIDNEQNRGTITTRDGRQTVPLTPGANAPAGRGGGVRLAIAEQACGVMSGTIPDTTLAGVPGSLRVITSEWRATLDDGEDADYRRRVAEFASAPIPEVVTNAYIEGQQREFIVLQSQATTAYRRCVFALAMSKMQRVAMVAYEHMLQEYAKSVNPRSGTGCERFVDRAAMIRIEEAEKQFQKLGMSCAALDWREVFGQKVRDELRSVLQSQHTLADLICFERLSEIQTVDLQDLGEPLAQEFQRMLSNALAPK